MSFRYGTMKISTEIFPHTSKRSTCFEFTDVSGGSQFAAGEGGVRLIGTVGTETDRQVIEEWIRRAGPHDYFDAVDVDGNTDHEDAEDTRTAAVAGAALIPHLDLMEDCVLLRVTNGWVELDGEVTDFTVRETLGQIVRELQGVSGLTNCLGVRSPVSVEQLSRQLTEALDRIPKIAARLP